MRPARQVIQDRDDEFVAKLFIAHREQLERHLTRLLGNPAQARDVAQDAYERLCTLDLRAIENPAAYLFQAATNIAITFMRRRKVEAQDVLHRTPLEDDAEKIVGPETRAILEQSIAHLEEQIWLLSPALREAIVLRYLEGMEPSEIIRRLGITATAYEQRITAAKRQLRQALRALGVDPLAL